MTKDEILSRSREENKERDLYRLSIDRNAQRVGVIVMYAVALILTIVHVIQTGKLNYMLWIVALSVDTAMDIYKAITLKSKKAIVSALILVVVDVAMTLFLFRDLYEV